MMTNRKSVVLAALLMLPFTCVHAIKILHGPYLQDVSETEATIVWVTDSTSVGWVETAPADGSSFYAAVRPRFYDTAIGIKRETRVHSVRLTGLRPGTQYRYRIYAQEVLKHRGIHVHYGNITATAAYGVPLPTFRTLDKSKPDVSFVVVNDIHEHKDVLGKLMEVSDCKTRDMVFFNGDMLSLFDDAERKLFGGFMDTAVQVFAKEVPLYYVRGNHETRGQKAHTFHDYVCPRNPNIYFTVEQGPVLFICLDTGEDKPDTDIEYAGITDYNNYRSEQAEWLKQVVASEAFKRAKHKVVIAHVPPRYDNTAWHGDLEVGRKFVPILNEAGIDLMICGHLHRFVYEDANARHRFPLLVNTNDAAVVATSNGDKLEVKVMGTDGKVSWSKTF